MTEAVEEEDFPHAPSDPMDEKILTLGKWTFNLSGVVHDFRDVLKRFQEGLKHWTDRGPDPEREDRESLRDLVKKTVRATVEIQGDYHEGGNGSSPSWRNWVMGMLGTLIVLGIASLITMFANQKAMEARMNGVEQRITNIEHKIWP
jgi:hypothetical protein